ncbi:DUF1772 domain-containing protein [Myxosarcina sp. GI1]|uniref:DUF1772 domain-containing protein n=1 Tax=Myxosarcina sp. GI1 TaxID=1541065 RepID=UPI0005605172|nr:DUF1772 domain-containing protein [Myxosarcina sp. GI1]
MQLVLLVLLLNSALLTGNEFAVSTFIHPSLSADNHRSNLPTIQHFAKLYGRVMPFWMGMTTGLHTLVSAIAWFYFKSVFPWLFATASIWAIVILYSLIFPVPLNNRVKEWDITELPLDWEQTRSKWDLYNWIRVIFLILAFILLSMGFKASS